MQLAEGQVFQLPFERPHAQAIGQRGVQLLDLKRDAPAGSGVLLARMAGPNQLQRKPRQHQPRIPHHGQQHLAQHFGLVPGQRPALRPLRIEVEITQARETGRQPHRFGPEERAHRSRNRRVVCLIARGVQQRADGQRQVVGEREHQLGGFARELELPWLKGQRRERVNALAQRSVMPGRTGCRCGVHVQSRYHTGMARSASRAWRQFDPAEHRLVSERAGKARPAKSAQPAAARVPAPFPRRVLGLDPGASPAEVRRVYLGEHFKM